MALLASSAAIDAADNTVCQAAVPNGAGGFDQRGITRLQGNQVQALQNRIASAYSNLATGLRLNKEGVLRNLKIKGFKNKQLVVLGGSGSVRTGCLITTAH